MVSRQRLYFLLARMQRTRWSAGLHRCEEGSLARNFATAVRSVSAGTHNLHNYQSGGLQSRNVSVSSSINAGLPSTGQGSYLKWPPPASALQSADEGITALVDSHQRQVQEAAGEAEQSKPKKRNIWEPKILEVRQHSTTQEAVMAEPVFARVLESSEVADILVAAHTSEVCIIDVRYKCDYTEFLVLATAQSPGQASAAAGAVLCELKLRCKEVVQGVVPGIEGSRGKDDWLLIDAGSVIVHIFTEEARAAYDFEEIWRCGDGSNVRRVESSEQSIQTLKNMRI